MRLGDRISGWLGAAGALAGMSLLMATSAYADFGRGGAYEFGLQDAASPVAHDIAWFNDLVFWIMVVITLFVMALLAIVIVKFNSKANPTPAHFHHNTMLEVAWTVIPIAILVVIAIPSFRLLYSQYAYPKPDLTIKAVGNQWYWTYEYADAKGVSFDSYMLKDDESQALRDKGVDAPRTLAVDNEVVVPINKVVHVLVTSKDVIHSWVIPSFGVRQDGVPGRVAATWFKADRPGIYYGVCSELCGRDHAFMPVAVRVVAEDVYNKWVDIRKAGGKDADQKARALIQASLAQPNKSCLLYTSPSPRD